MTPAKFLAAISGRSLHPSDVPGGGKPEWTVAEAGIALSGLEPKYMAAIMFRWAGDKTQRKILKKELTKEAIIFQAKEKWPKVRKGRDYLIDLVNIALFEEWPADVRNWGRQMILDPETTVIQRKLLKYGVFWPVAMGVSIIEWRIFYSKKYEAILGLLDNWASVAHEHMSHKMRVYEGNPLSGLRFYE